MKPPQKCKKHGVVHKNGGYPSCNPVIRKSQITEKTTVEVPTAWLKGLIVGRDRIKKTIEMEWLAEPEAIITLLGYLDSVETILKME